MGALGAVLEASWAVLGVSWALLRWSWRHLEGQHGPKTEPGRSPNRVPEATRAENGETLIFDDSTQDFNDFSCLRVPSWHQKWVQHGFQKRTHGFKLLSPHMPCHVIDASSAFGRTGEYAGDSVVCVSDWLVSALFHCHKAKFDMTFFVKSVVSKRVDTTQETD